MFDFNVYSTNANGLNSTRLDERHSQVEYISKFNDIPEQTIMFIDFPIVVSIMVSSTQAWTDTGLNVSSGDTLIIEATGYIQYAPTSPQADPNGSGISSNAQSYLVPSNSLWANALVGNIAPAPSYDGKGFFVGSSFNHQIPITNTTSESGRLLLGFNDGFIEGNRTRMNPGAVMDNSGFFTAKITLIPKPISSPPAPSLPILPDRPVAHIDPIQRKSTSQGTTIDFNGSGTPRGGAQIVGYKWYDDMGNELSEGNHFSKSDLAFGKHKVFFTVKDNFGQWSDPVTIEVILLPDRPIAHIDPIQQKSTRQGTTFEFNGSGIPRGDAQIVEYRWNDEKGQYLSGDEHLSKSDLTYGTHKIYFSLKDNYDQWSDAAFIEVTVEETRVLKILKPLVPLFYSIIAASFGVIFGLYIRRDKRKQLPISQTKECPFCCTNIPINASKCPNCTSELPMRNSDTR